MGLHINELSVFLHVLLVPRGCGPPPPLQNGDIRESIRVQYRHNERVEYVCKSYHTMQGSPFKTCSNGDWIGREMTCLSKLLSVVSFKSFEHYLFFRKLLQGVERTIFSFTRVLTTCSHLMRPLVTPIKLNLSKIENTNRVCYQSQYGGLMLFVIIPMFALWVDKTAALCEFML